MVKKYFVAAILLLTAFTLAAFDLHRQMTGVIICHSGTPTPSALCAAKELQTALKRTLDINAGIVSGTIPEKYSALFIVGEMEKYPLLEKLEWDAFTIDSPGKNILQLAGKDDHRKPKIEGTENGKADDNLNAGNKEFFGTVMGKFGDIEQITGDAGHNGTHFGIVIIRKGKFMQMGKQVAAHIRFHIYTHDMTHRVHIKLSGAVNEAQQDIQQPHF